MHIGGGGNDAISATASDGTTMTQRKDNNAKKAKYQLQIFEERVTKI
jgi:hypothetical protein